MLKPDNCNQNSDPLKLIRDGDNQDSRISPALDPSYVSVNEHGAAHGMLFAQALSEFVDYFDSTNSKNGSWAPFFSKDPSLLLALASVQNMEDYKSQIKSYFDFLNDQDNESNEDELKNNLTYLFSCLITLAKQLDRLKDGLPAEIALKLTLKNLIQTRLAPALQRLISYQKGGVDLFTDCAPTNGIKILGVLPDNYTTILDSGFSKDWITDNSVDWKSFTTGILPEPTVYGETNENVFNRVNHFANHNLFTSISDQFLKVFSRVINEARDALEFTFTNLDSHEPHYALFLSFLRLMEYARAETNTITARHLDFYYREILQLKEKPALPAQTYLIAELAKQAASYQLKSGDLLKAGKDEKGIEALYAVSRDLIANQARVTSLQTIYRHGMESVGSGSDANAQTGRLYASPKADSGDGLGAALTSTDLSWHPFYNKNYTNGKLVSIQMPLAEMGFAIASHYLWLAEGKRSLKIDFTTTGYHGKLNVERSSEIVCLFSGEKGWIEKSPDSFMATNKQNIQLLVTLAGDDPPVVAFNPKKLGYGFNVSSPVIIIKLRNETDILYSFPVFENVKLSRISLQVSVDQVKNLVLSNDFGPVDASKPFLPFGALPENGSSLILGSNEMFIKKNVTSCKLAIHWKNVPHIQSVPFSGKEENVQFKYDPTAKLAPWANITFLKEGIWDDLRYQKLFNGSDDVEIDIVPNGGFNKEDRPDFQTDTQFSVKSNTGFLKLSLPFGLGHKEYREALSDYLLAFARTKRKTTKPVQPYTPEVEAISANYTAIQIINLHSADQSGFEKRSARFFNLGSFGFAEQHAYLKTKAPDQDIYLFPQLRHLNISDASVPENHPVIHEAEFFIGISGLNPPQNLALLIQVSDGTANPQVVKPPDHINWSYLVNNEWIQLSQREVDDQTNGLLKSGITTFSMPRDASADNTILPSGQHWIRAAVASRSDAVCRLMMVSAQGVLATFKDMGNDPAYSGQVLPAGSISKLKTPVAEVKKITQPYESFGGRGAEEPSAFYTRVSERLRHKDRAVTLWDFERLVLEAFPEIYRVKCLNHTQYEPQDNETGIYRELAPGHITLVTIPDKQFHNFRDPLKPFTSLGLLNDIAVFLTKRLSCFATLHVNNPQFEEVRVHLKVRFYDGFDETFYTGLLQQSIMRFLSPWAFPDGGNPSFGGKVYKSVLIDFVEEQPYVDYVTNVQLFHDIGGKKGTTDKNEIMGSMAVSVLVSVPADFHAISVINPSDEIPSSEKCSCQP